MNLVWILRADRIKWHFWHKCQSQLFQIVILIPVPNPACRLWHTSVALLPQGCCSRHTPDCYTWFVVSPQTWNHELLLLLYIFLKHPLEHLSKAALLCLQTLFCSIAHVRIQWDALQSSELPGDETQNKYAGIRGWVLFTRRWRKDLWLFLSIYGFFHHIECVCTRVNRQGADEFLVRFSPDQNAEREIREKDRGWDIKEERSDGDELAHVFSQTQMCWRPIFYHISSGTCCSWARLSRLTSLRRNIII